MQLNRNEDITQRKQGMFYLKCLQGPVPGVKKSLMFERINAIKQGIVVVNNANKKIKYNTAHYTYKSNNHTQGHTVYEEKCTNPLFSSTQFNSMQNIQIGILKVSHKAHSTYVFS